MQARSVWSLSTQDEINLGLPGIRLDKTRLIWDCWRSNYLRLDYFETAWNTSRKRGISLQMPESSLFRPECRSD